MFEKKEKRNWLPFLRGEGVPHFVQENLKQTTEGKLPWISTMNASEFLLCASHGFQPISTVMGTCWVNAGYSWTEGHKQGWSTALNRLKAEAAAAGANAVVDVKMQTIRLENSRGMDYSLIGTAVKIQGLPASKNVVCATCPAFEFVRLLESGIVPIGIAIGASYKWFTDTDKNLRSLRKSWFSPSQPVDVLRDFWERVRRDAHAELRNDVIAMGANGALADVHFGELLCVEGGEENSSPPDRYLGRHIVIATTLSCAKNARIDFDIRLVVDLAQNNKVDNQSTSAYQRALKREKVI